MTEALPNGQEVVVEVTEDLCLSVRIGVETLKFVRAGGEQSDGLSFTPLDPLFGLPPQELEDSPHLLLEK